MNVGKAGEKCTWKLEWGRKRGKVERGNVEIGLNDRKSLRKIVEGNWCRNETEEKWKGN